jgi:hypothetical protein
MGDAWRESIFMQAGSAEYVEWDKYGCNIVMRI